jgi:ribonuclease BN (tRNA processing enzyme)
VKLHILGCGDAFGSGGRNQSGYLVETSDRLFLLDCGPTTLLAMKRVGFNPRRLDAIFLSHLHGDHFGGIPFFFVVRRRGMSRPLAFIYCGLKDHCCRRDKSFLFSGAPSGAGDISNIKSQL